MKIHWQADAASGLYKTQESFNQHKMEKVLDKPVATLKVNEEFNDKEYGYLRMKKLEDGSIFQAGVYIRQAVKNNECFTVEAGDIYLRKNGNCDVIRNDLTNAIKR